MREVRVLEVITTTMGRDGLTLAPLRLASRMTRARCDFVASAVADEGVRAMVEATGGRLFLAPSRLRRPLRYVRFLARLIRENGYDAVHAHGNSCTLAVDLFAAKLGGARARIAHSHNSQCRYRLLHRLLRPAFDALYTCAMACSAEAGRWLFPKRPFEIVRNPVDARAFAFDPAARASAREELGLRGGRPRGWCWWATARGAPRRRRALPRWESPAACALPARGRTSRASCRAWTPCCCPRGSRAFRWSRWSGSARGCPRGCPTPSRAIAR